MNPLGHHDQGVWERPGQLLSPPTICSISTQDRAVWRSRGGPHVAPAYLSVPDQEPTQRRVTFPPRRDHPRQARQTVPSAWHSAPCRQACTLLLADGWRPRRLVQADCRLPEHGVHGRVRFRDRRDQPHPRARSREDPTILRGADPGARNHLVRLELDIKGGSVTILECRPPWSPDMGPEWTRFAIARLRFTATRGEWTLYWRDRNLASTGTRGSARTLTSPSCWPRSRPIRRASSGADGSATSQICLQNSTRDVELCA